MFGQLALNCGIRSESFSTAHSDRRRPQVTLERSLHFADPCATRANCEGTVSRTPTSAASPSSAASWPKCTHPRTVQKLNSGQFPSPAMSGGHKFLRWIKDRFAFRGIPGRHALRLGTAACNQPKNCPRTALGSGPAHLLAITPSEPACSSLRLPHGNSSSAFRPAAGATESVRRSRHMTLPR